MNIPLLKMSSFSVQAKRIVPRDTEVLGCFCSLRHRAPHKHMAMKILIFSDGVEVKAWLVPPPHQVQTHSSSCPLPQPGQAHGPGNPDLQRAGEVCSLYARPNGQW